MGLTPAPRREETNQRGEGNAIRDPLVVPAPCDVIRNRTPTPPVPTTARLRTLLHGSRHSEVSKGLAVLRDVVRLVPGHLGARLLMARAFYSTDQADLAHQALQVRRRFAREQETSTRAPLLHLKLLQENAGQDFVPLSSCGSTANCCLHQL